MILEHDEKMKVTVRLASCVRKMMGGVELELDFCLASLPASPDSALSLM